MLVGEVMPDQTMTSKEARVSITKWYLKGIPRESSGISGRFKRTTSDLNLRQMKKGRKKIIIHRINNARLLAF